jgi:hypothetical protein
MPKIDPVTGCEVMTTAEFWQSTAKAEGREPGELMQEFYDELEEDNRKAAEELRDPKNAFNIIVKYLEEDDEASLECYNFSSQEVVECLEVFNSEVNQGIRGSESELEAVLLLRDGSTRTVVFGTSETYSTMLDPGDYDSYLRVTEVNGKPVVHEYARGCAHQYDHAHSVPVCEACEAFGGAALHGMINPAAYLVPASTDRGATVHKWVRVCVVHGRSWYEGSGWIGPRIKLNQESPELPWVRPSTMTEAR